MGCPVSDFFQLVLGVPSKLTLDAVNKSLEAPEFFWKKAFNSDYMMGVASLLRRLCWAHLRLMALQKKVAAKEVWFIPMAPEVLK